jgi:hypothetical protein
LLEFNFVLVMGEKRFHGTGNQAGFSDHATEIIVEDATLLTAWMSKGMFDTPECFLGHLLQKNANLLYLTHEQIISTEAGNVKLRSSFEFFCS